MFLLLRSTFSSAANVLLIAGALFLGMSQPARADVVRLLSGGELRGTIQESKSTPEELTVSTATGTRIVVPQDQIDFVERRSPLVEEYVTRSRRVPNTVEARWELAEWCRTNQLQDERKEQLEILLDLDHDHAEARNALGYIKHLGRWTTREDEMASRGYIRHEGRWVTQQELELKLSNATQHKAELAWIPKIRVWAQWLTGSDPQRAATGMGELRKITDPDAIAALTKHLATHPVEDVRILYVSIVGKIDSGRVVPPLVDRILTDASHVVRRAALTALTPARYPQAMPMLINALKHKLNPIVCNAAEALEEIGDERAVPALIDALVTRHLVQVVVPVNQGVTFTSGNPGPFSGTLPPSVEIAARTGQLPYGAQVIDNTPKQMKAMNVARDFKNLPVLNALESLTGHSFGFNERDWHLWWAIQKG